MSTKWTGLLVALWLGAAGLPALAADADQLTRQERLTLPSPSLSTRIALDVSYQMRPQPTPSAVDRFQFSETGTLHDAASTPNGAAIVGGGFGFAWMSAISTSTDSLLAGSRRGNATVQFTWQDRVAIIPQDSSLMGRPGRLTGILAVEGYGHAEQHTDAVDGPGMAWADYGIALQMNGQTLSTGGRWEAFGAGGNLFTGDPFGAKAVMIDFVFGEEFDVNLNASIQSLAGAGSSWASVHLSSIRWMGIADIQDSTGNFIGDYTIIADSGLNWAETAAVPEPAMAGLLLVLMLLRQRPRRAP